MLMKHDKLRFEKKEVLRGTRGAKKFLVRTTLFVKSFLQLSWSFLQFGCALAFTVQLIQIRTLIPHGNHAIDILLVQKKFDRFEIPKLRWKNKNLRCIQNQNTHWQTRENISSSGTSWRYGMQVRQWYLYSLPQKMIWFPNDFRIYRLTSLRRNSLRLELEFFNSPSKRWIALIDNPMCSKKAFNLAVRSKRGILRRSSYFSGCFFS